MARRARDGGRLVGILFVQSLVVLAWIVAVSIVLLLPQRTAPGATATPV